MSNRDRAITILIVDDDDEDREMTREALEESRLGNNLEFKSDGEELMTHLRRCVRGGDDSAPSMPGIILLDLNMPKKDGREALEEIKSDPQLRSIPVVVLTTSQAEEDIVRSYDLGVSSFISKPVTFAGLVDAMKVLSQYWFEIVELPE